MVEYGMINALNGVLSQFGAFASNATGFGTSIVASVLTSIGGVLQSVLSFVQSYLPG